MTRMVLVQRHLEEERRLLDKTREPVPALGVCMMEERKTRMGERRAGRWRENWDEYKEEMRADRVFKMQMARWNLI